MRATIPRDPIDLLRIGASFAVHKAMTTARACFRRCVWVAALATAGGCSSAAPPPPPSDIETAAIVRDGHRLLGGAVGPSGTMPPTNIRVGDGLEEHQR